ncbi:MAG: efflux RND transporter permease subunit [candidate division Zixibacteria bacterium]|nr:efflux RND transporter permease subunit [candidate division Zixibacteria bacterium]
MKISEISIKRPVFATMMIGALLVLGLFSYFGLPIELMPNVDFPFVVVQTVYPGASAETVETEVTNKIEEVVNQISGVRHITSRSREGYMFSFIEFELEKEGAVAAQDVREKVATVRGDLPEDIEEPIVSQFDPEAQAIMSLVISGKRPPRELTQITKDKIKPRLETVSGVGQVTMVGSSEREIRIALDIEKMEAYGVSVQAVQQSVTAANLEIPGGRVDEAATEYLVRMQGRVNNVADFNDVIVKNEKGTPIYLKDIARVIDTVVEQRSLSSYNGNPALGLEITRQSGANVVDLAQQIRAVLAQLNEELPPDMKIVVVNDNSTWIEDSVHEILFNIRLGTFLAVLVIFLFLLDYRPTIITGLSIPISLVATFTAMKFLNFTINTMTLMSLSLAVGILIDDAIVVVENIYRHLSEGKSPFKAAYDGTREIGLAVMATTFSIMVVFLPVAFMEGIVGRFFYQFGMTVAFAILISLFVAFTLTPMMSSRMLRPEKAEKNGDFLARGGTTLPGKIWHPIFKVLNYWNVFFDAFKPRYKTLLASALDHRWLVILIATVTFVLALVLGSFLGSEFFPETDQGKLYISVETPPGTNLEGTSNVLSKIEDIVMGLPEVANRYVTIGAGNNPVTDGNILVQLVDVEERILSAKMLADSVRNLISDIPGIKYSIGIEEGHAGGSKPVELSIRGENPDELARLVHKVQNIAYTVPGTIDIDNTLQEGKPEIRVDIDRKLADDLGLNLALVHQSVRYFVEGDVVTRFKDGDEDYDVRVQLDESYRSSMSDLGRILVESNKEVPGVDPFLVPLSRVAHLDRQTSIGEYMRFDRQREARVNTNVLTGYFAGTISQQIMARVGEEIKLPPGYVIAPVGTQEIMTESFQNIFKALLLAVIFIYFLLASQYESFFDPFSIMFSLPLSLIGAILGLLIFNDSLSIMSLIGIVLLMGLVTKNAILLIDFVKQQREKGVPRKEAILIAGPIRLRPILMTTFATIFGMLPLALGLGPGAELRAPMARAVMGGMISSTLLTLVVVPIVYTLIDDIVEFFSKKIFRRTKKMDRASIEKEFAVDTKFDNPR